MSTKRFHLFINTHKLGLNKRGGGGYSFLRHTKRRNNYFSNNIFLTDEKLPVCPERDLAVRR